MTALQCKFQLPSYLGKLFERCPFPEHGRRYGSDFEWRRHLLESILAPYDLRTIGTAQQSGVMEYVRPESAVHVERKVVRDKDRYLDVVTIDEGAYQNRKDFENALVAAATAARPLRPPLQHVRPMEEQLLLMSIVIGDRKSVYAYLDQQPKALIKLYGNRPILDALAFCPDATFRKDFIEKYRDRMVSGRTLGGVDTFISYQAQTIGYEGPGIKGSVFSSLIDPENMPEQWLEYLLAQGQKNPGTLERACELLQRGCPVDPSAVAQLRHAAKKGDIDAVVPHTFASNGAARPPVRLATSASM